MTKFAMLIAVAVFSVCVQPLAAVADEVPKFDVKKSCRADVQAYPGGGTPDGCLADEQKARDQLVSQWTQFGPESRTKCTEMVNDNAGHSELRGVADLLANREGSENAAQRLTT